jgi:hypothetical protein
MGNELRAILHLHLNWRWMQLEKLLNRVGHVIGLAESAHPNSQADALFSSTTVKDLSVRLSIVWSNWKSMAHPWCGYSALCSSLDPPVGLSALSAPQEPVEPLRRPNRLHPLVINTPAILSQPSIDQPLTPTHIASGQLTDPPPQLLLLDHRRRHRSPLDIAVLAHLSANTSLENPESIMQNYYGTASTVQAQNSCGEGFGYGSA